MADETQVQQPTPTSNNRTIVYALLGFGLGLLAAYVALPLMGYEAPKDLITIVGTIVGVLGGVLKGGN